MWLQASFFPIAHFSAGESHATFATMTMTTTITFPQGSGNG